MDEFKEINPGNPIGPSNNNDHNDEKTEEKGMKDIITIQGINCYEEKGVAYLNLEAVARGLGFTTTQMIDGKEYVNIRWARVEEYLRDLGFATSGKRPEYIPENIFYRLAMKAKNETAERFQALIADKVIPAIRKHGAYLTPEAAWKLITSPESIIQMCNNWKADRAMLAEAHQKIEADRPKVLFAKSVQESEGSILIGTLAKLLKQNGVDIGEKRLFQKLREEGYLCSIGERKNLPTQKSMDMKLFEVTERTFLSPDGSKFIKQTTKVTGKGQVYFVNRYAGKQ